VRATHDKLADSFEKIATGEISDKEAEQIIKDAREAAKEARLKMAVMRSINKNRKTLKAAVRKAKRVGYEG
jgi:hypothetical protein